MSDGRPLRAYAEVALGRQRAPEHEDGPHMVRYLRAANVKDGALDLDDVKAMNFEPGEQHIFSLKPGDVLVTEGSGSRSVVGASAVWNGELPGVVCFQNTLLRLRPRSATDPRFLAWWCRYARNAGLFASIATGANIFHVSADRVRSLPMSYLPPAEQEAIADFLDTETARIDALITRKRRMIELVRERFLQSVDSKFKALEHVPRHKLTWLSHTWCDGPFGSSLTSAHYSDSGARVVRLGNLGRGEFVNLDEAFVSVEYFQSLRRHEVLEGDLIVAGLGDEKRPLARACVAPELGPAMVKADCFRFRLRTELVSPDFVAWYLSSPSAVAGSAVLAQGSTRARANLATVCGLRVPLPHQTVQQLVVEGIQRERAATSDVATRLKEQVQLLQERRQALITTAVTGRLEIPGVAA